MLLIALLVLGLAWAGVLAVVLAVCVNAARGDRGLVAPRVPLAAPRRLRAVA